MFFYSKITKNQKLEPIISKTILYIKATVVVLLHRSKLSKNVSYIHKSGRCVIAPRRS